MLLRANHALRNVNHAAFGALTSAGKAAFAAFTKAENDVGSLTAMSASIRRSTSMPARLRPWMKRLYVKPSARAPALMRWIDRQSRADSHRYVQSAFDREDSCGARPTETRQSPRQPHSCHALPRNPTRWCWAASRVGNCPVARKSSAPCSCWRLVLKMEDLLESALRVHST